MRIRWYLYVGGVSVESKFNIVGSIVILITSLIEVKCTRFLHKLYNLSVAEISKSKTENINPAQTNFHKI